jgi:hypothetical protein
MFRAGYQSGWPEPGKYTLLIVSDQRIAEAWLTRGEAAPEIAWSILHSEITKVSGLGRRHVPTLFRESVGYHLTLYGTREYRLWVSGKEEEQVLISIWDRYCPPDSQLRSTFWGVPEVSR